MLETDVLIVGCGPAGGAAALTLSTYGINNLVINKYGWTAKLPRAHITNQRTLEVLRDMGIEEESKLHSVPQEFMANNVFCTSLAGEEFGRIHAWGNHPARKAEYELASPCGYCDLQQPKMEPLLLSHATKRGSKVRFNTEYLGHEQNEDHVIATVKDRLTGESYKVRCKYLIGADGGNSKVAEDLGLAMEGKMGVSGSMNILFEADLTKYVEYRPSVLYWILQPGSDIGGVGMGVIRLVERWNKWLVVWGYDISQGKPEMTDEHVISILHNLIGDDTLDINVEAYSFWTVNDMYATELHKGRVFCVGDAVHRHPPTNGLGSNVSIQDSYNLAWKMAMVLKGQADPSLLESFDEERLPVAKQTCYRANKSIADFGGIFGALGLFDTHDPEVMKQRIDSRKDDTPEGAKKREALNAAIDFTNYVYNAHGIEMNQRYTSRAVIPDGTPGPDYSRDEELYYEATTYPGAKLPHVWLRKIGDTKKVVSTLDLVGKGRFTLITGIGGQNWVNAVNHFKEQSGIKMAVFVLGPGQDYEDIFGDWMHVRGIQEDGCLLVRPDGHIAWRQKVRPGNAVEELFNAMGQVTGKTIRVTEATVS